MQISDGRVEVRSYLERWNEPAVLDEFDDLDYTFFANSVIDISNARVLPSGIVAKNGRLVDISLHRHPERTRVAHLRVVKSLLLKRPAKLPDDRVYTVCYCDWSSGFFHWITEALPRMLHARTRQPDCTMIVPYLPQIAAIIDETVARAGFKDTLRLSRRETLMVPQLCLPSVPWPMGGYDPEDLRLVRRAMVLPNSPIQKKRRLFISRRKAKYRHILNEDRVERLLHDYGFETIIAEDYSFAQQIEMFSQAEAVASIHGAGLTNMIWCDPGATIVEFIKEREETDLSAVRSSRYLNPSYPRMAAVLGHKYATVLCLPAEPGLPAKAADIIVNIEAAAAALGRLGLHQTRGAE